MGVATVDQKYEKINLDKYFYYKSSRPIEINKKFTITEISKNSPIDITFILGSIGGLWVLVQVIDKIANWTLNREKLRLEVEKLKSENKLIRMDQEHEEAEYIEFIEEDVEIQRRISRIKSELSDNQMKLEEMEIKS